MLRSTHLSRARALAEVLLVFAAVHVTFRALLHFTAIGAWELRTGVYVTPGLVLLAATGVAVLLSGRQAAEFGLTWRGAGRGVVVGLGAFAISIAFALALSCIVQERDLAGFSWRDAIWIVPASACACAFAVRLLRIRALELVGARTQWAGVVLFAILWSSPFAVAGMLGRPLGSTALALLARTCFAGIAEEAFFRGYVQTRVDQAFEPRWTWMGVRFGAGLIVSAVLFGAVHALNPFDYFTGEGRLAWVHGLVTALSPAGFLRAKSGSVASATTLHVLIDVAAQIPRVVAG